LADVFGRRLAVIAGVVLTGLGFVLEGSIPRFEAIVIGQALFGLGVTLSDGADPTGEFPDDQPSIPSGAGQGRGRDEGR
jgi:hypothetical protein